ncbi:MAG TPA: flagellar hook-length control protein FliK, partial [Phenylobacterium sp.]|nr:flagellar hook-length control protein FliK [Phenylobacterium sp.]
PKVPPSDANGKAKGVDFAQALAATRQGARSDAIKEERATQVGYKPPPAAPSTVDARPETVDPVQPPVEAAVEAEVAAAELPGPAPLSGKDRAHLRAGRAESGRKGETPTSLVGAASPDLADKPATPSLAALAVKPDQVDATDGADAASSEPKTEFVAANTDIPDDTIAAQGAPVSAHATPASAQAAAAAARGAPETVASLAAQIVKKLEGRTTRFDVQLHPADLGRVDVRLEIGAHGRLMASMSFENPHAAAELRGRADELRSALESAGFDLSGGLSFDVAGDRGQGQRQAQDNTPDGGGALRGRAFEAALATADETASAALAGALNAYQSRVAPGLDIRI